MTTYFITGATGFLGRNLLTRLLARPDCERVYALVRPQSAERFAETVRALEDASAVTVIQGDVTLPGLGIDDRALPPQVDHVVHLAAIYDFTADAQLNQDVNVTGTQQVIEFARSMRASWLHHVSSIAVAGDHRGVFTEHDFNCGQNFPSPYHATKYAAERLVREQSAVPWRVYRPAAVAGDSRTGEMDKIDGPYYFLPAIKRLRRLPARMPLAMPALGSTNIVPVDFVADALGHLIHADAGSGSTFHLVADQPQPLTEVYNAFAKSLGAPTIRVTAPQSLSKPVVRAARRAVTIAASTVDTLPGGKQAREAVLNELGVPPQVLPHLSLAARFTTGKTREALGEIAPPRFSDYASQLVDYWSKHLDPDRAIHPSRRRSLAGRTVLITGASSGIGAATATAVARLGGTALLVARRADELNQIRDDIAAEGGTAYVHPCDLTDGDEVDALVKDVLTEHGHVDMLVNNAGRSIRRSVRLSVERMHDYERTMELNYFAPMRLILGFLPRMRERRFGHIVNITSMGLQTDTPRFSAYLASKAALEAFGRSAGRETLGDGVLFTSVRMPLVRTPMIRPTSVYRALPATSPDKAAQLVVKALTSQSEVVQRPEGKAAELLRVLAPSAARQGLHLAYRVMPESAPEAKEKPRPPLASIAATVTRGLWRRL